MVVAMSEVSHHLLVEPEHSPRAAIGNESHLAPLARLEADGGAGRNIEAVAARGRAVETEAAIGLGEMVMAAHLHGPVAGIGDLKHGDLRAFVEGDLAVCRKEFSWDHLRPLPRKYPPARARRPTTTSHITSIPCGCRCAPAWACASVGRNRTGIR